MPLTKTKSRQRPRILTIGHSNRSIREFIDIIESRRLRLLIDVRTIPQSRHNPQFGMTRLKRSLAARGIDYIHMPGLGGLRKPRKDSMNTAWRNPGFRGFADYMQTEEFEKDLKSLIAKAKRKRLMIMCAEAVPWRCHRSLIADAIVAKGMAVEDIMSRTSHRVHKLTPFAKRRRGRVHYPAE